MKHLIRLIFALIFVTILSSCNKKDDYVITELIMVLDKNKILDDNQDGALVTVTDQLGSDVSTRVGIYVEDNIILGRKVSSDAAGTLQVHAEIDGIISNSIILTVVEDIGLNYNKVVLLEQFTATWCGFCPRAISFISNLLLVDSDVAHIAYHLNDEFSYLYNSHLFQSFGQESIPVVIAGREFVWNYSSYQLDNIKGPTRTGISVTYGGNISNIDVDVEVSFGMLYPEPLALTLYLIEDNLMADQYNYYNDDPDSPWFGAGDILYDFFHENVMVKTLTDMYGDQIPAGSTDIGSVYQASYSIAPGLNDINNSSIVAFVSYDNGIDDRVVINAIVCDYGETVESSLYVAQ